MVASVHAPSSTKSILYRKCWGMADRDAESKMHMDTSKGVYLRRSAMGSVFAVYLVEGD